MILIFQNKQNINSLIMIYWYYVSISNSASDELIRRKYNTYCLEFYELIVDDLTEFVNSDAFKKSYLDSIIKCNDIVK